MQHHRSPRKPLTMATAHRRTSVGGTRQRACRPSCLGSEVRDQPTARPATRTPTRATLSMSKRAVASSRPFRGWRRANTRPAGRRDLAQQELHRRWCVRPRTAGTGRKCRSSLSMALLTSPDLSHYFDHDNFALDGRNGPQLVRNAICSVTCTGTGPLCFISICSGRVRRHE